MQMLPNVQVGQKDGGGGNATLRAASRVFRRGR